MQVWNILQEYPTQWHLLFIMECFKMTNKRAANFLLFDIFLKPSKIKTVAFVHFP